MDMPSPSMNDDDIAQLRETVRDQQGELAELRVRVEKLSEATRVLVDVIGVSNARTLSDVRLIQRLLGSAETSVPSVADSPAPVRSSMPILGEKRMSESEEMARKRIRNRPPFTDVDRAIQVRSHAWPLVCIVPQCANWLGIRFVRTRFTPSSTM
jgi:hypothetical protein